MRIHLVNPSDLSFGTAVITPRWMYVLAATTPARFGTPTLVDETLEPFEPDDVATGDVVGIGIHTSNALRGYAIGRLARARGALVVFGGIHATLFPDEAREHSGAHAVVRGDGDLVWPRALADCEDGRPAPIYDGGRIEGGMFASARWDLLPENRYMWGSVQTVRGCPKHCSFCSVWRTDGQKPRQRGATDVVLEVVALRRKGFRFILLADDNFYPVTLSDLATAARRADREHLDRLTALRQERFELMAQLEALPDDMVFFTQITMEAAEDPEFLAAMRRARIRGALVGVESVTREGLKAVFKDFNDAGEVLVARLQAFRANGVHVLGSFIFGLPTDTADTFDATADLAHQSGVSFAQFVMLTPFPGTVDFAKWEQQAIDAPTVNGVPLTRYWLIPSPDRPKVYAPHPSMSAEEIRRGTQRVWDRFYSLAATWRRSSCVRSLRARLAFVLISKLYRQMYANTGIATDSARVARSARRARWLAKVARRLFVAAPMPNLAEPSALPDTSGGRRVAVRAVGVVTALTSVALGLQLSAASAPNAEVVTAAMEKFLARPATVHPYRAWRHLEASGSGQQGWLHARTDFTPASGLQYAVTAEGGSGYIRSRILRSLLDEEQRLIARGGTADVAISVENYRFTAESVEEGLAVVRLIPLRKDRSLIVGRMFLRPAEGDLVRVEGRLAKSPSFWLTRVTVVRSYRRLNSVLVPVSLESTGRLRLLGRSTLRMTYHYSEVDDRPVGDSGAQ